MAANDALLLIGHGSARLPDAGAMIEGHLQRVRAAERYAQIELAMLNGEPAIAGALARITAPTIHVLPYFMEDGYFSRVAVPKIMENETRAIQFCPPVGLHPAMADILRAQALSGCADLGIPPDQAAIIVVGHGSAKAPGRAISLNRHVSIVASGGAFTRVEAACLEEPPLFADTLRRVAAHPTVVIGFFANRGGHVVDDVPDLIHAEVDRRGKHAPIVRFHASVTDHPTMANIILDQAELRKAE